MAHSHLLRIRCNVPPVDAASQDGRIQVSRAGARGCPHLDDVRLTSGPRDLRNFGSQGEQRLTVLALLLAEAELIAERRGFAPLLLLDDVLSELDPNRRRILAERVQGTGQTLVTATQASSLPVEPALLLEVTPGLVRAA